MQGQPADALTIAIAEVTSAEENLAQVLGHIRTDPHAEKTWTISKAVEEAFARLKVAKANLIALKNLTEPAAK